MRGEFEPMRAYGVLLDEATLKAKALELGLISTTDEALTPQQKILATHAEIMEQTSLAQGDFARTADGLPNTMRVLSAKFADLKVKIGERLLPAVLGLVEGFERFIGFVRDNQTPFIAALVGIGVALVVIALAIGAVAPEAVTVALRAKSSGSSWRRPGRNASSRSRRC